jgi:hypothetical protein
MARTGKTQGRSRLSRTDRADCPARRPNRVSGITLDFVSQKQPLEPRVVAAAEKALAKGLNPFEADYVSAARSRRPLRFTRFAAEIARLYPGCPAERAEAIARHAGLRGSGRVGRSADGRALDERAVGLAVVASIRHEDTDYDQLLMSGTARADARTQIKPVIDHVVAAWSDRDPW